jgi:DnaD/phage-associated family protein
MTDQLVDRRDLPVFIHSDVDDLPLSPNAFRLYCHLARRAGNGVAWPSYQTMGDKCYITESDNAGSRRTWAIKAMNELVELGLVKKELRQDDIKGNKSNIYCLTPRSEWIPPSIGGILGGVSSGYQAGIGGIPKGTPVEGSPSPVVVVDDADRGKVIQLFKDNMPGSLTPIIAEQLNDLIDTYGTGETALAITRACEANVRNLRYITAILANRAAGKDKPEPQQAQRTGQYNKPASKVAGSMAAVENVFAKMKEQGITWAE